jgi:hypothetical protein
MSGATIAVGSEIAPIAKVIFQRALAEASFSADSIHNDAYTKRSGYPGALVSAYVLAGYMSEPMVRLFGAGWFTSGKISLTFVGKGVQQGDPVSIGGRVIEVEPVPGGHRIGLEIWMDKADGSRPVVGRASAILADAGQA